MHNDERKEQISGCREVKPDTVAKDDCALTYGPNVKIGMVNKQKQQPANGEQDENYS